MCQRTCRCCYGFPPIIACTMILLVAHTRHSTIEMLAQVQHTYQAFNNRNDCAGTFRSESTRAMHHDRWYIRRVCGSCLCEPGMPRAFQVSSACSLCGHSDIQKPCGLLASEKKYSKYLYVVCRLRAACVCSLHLVINAFTRYGINSRMTGYVQEQQYIMHIIDKSIYFDTRSNDSSP